MDYSAQKYLRRSVVVLLVTFGKIFFCRFPLLFTVGVKSCLKQFFYVVQFFRRIFCGLQYLVNADRLCLAFYRNVIKFAADKCIVEMLKNGFRNNRL